MTGTEFRRLLELIYGPDWFGLFAAETEIHPRTLQRWVSDDPRYPVPGFAVAWIIKRKHRRIGEILALMEQLRATAQWSHSALRQAFAALETQGDDPP